MLYLVFLMGNVALIWGIFYSEDSSNFLTTSQSDVTHAVRIKYIKMPYVKRFSLFSCFFLYLLFRSSTVFDSIKPY